MHPVRSGLLPATHLIALTGLLGVAGAACLTAETIDPPAPDGARSLNLVEAGDRLLLSWIQPSDDESSLVFASFDGERWSAVQEIARGSSLLVNRADVPELAVAADGTMHAHWLETMGENSHAYGLRSARSIDGGATWERLGWLHDDESAVEHGFVSHAAGTSGRVVAFWLDGRTMPENGDTQLRVAALGASGPPDAEVLDDRVCECCSTDAAVTADGPLIVYRDRSQGEIRDISVVRRTAEGWSEPASIHEDGWHIEGCPVNGPAVSAQDQTVAVAWYTAAEPGPRVQLAFSADAGVTFGSAIVVDGGRPRGQVDVVMGENGATVVWLRREDGATEVVWRHVTTSGKAGPVQRVGPADGARLSGYPRLGRAGGQIVAVWGEVSETPRLRAVRLVSN